MIIFFEPDFIVVSFLIEKAEIGFLNLSLDISTMR